MEAPPPIVTDALARWPERFAMVALDEVGTVVWASPATVELLGRPPHDLVGRSSLELVHPDDVVSTLAVMAQNLERERQGLGSPELRFLFDVRAQHADGRWVPVEMSGVDLDGPDGRIVVLALRDFTHRRLLEDLVATATQGGSAAEVLQVTAAVCEFVVPDARVAGWARVAGEVARIGSPDLDAVLDHPAGAGRLRPVSGGWSVVVSDEPDCQAAMVIMSTQAELLVYQQREIERAVVLGGMALERLWREARLHRLAHTDPLTDVANRARLDEALRAACGDAVTVVLVDLDHFKPINDAHGHQVGDHVLVEAAARLREHVRPGDLVGRLGGDEFVVVCPGPMGKDDAAALGERLVSALSHPVRVDEVDVHHSASVGVVIAPTGGDHQELLRVADGVLYQAKAAGGGHALVVVA